MILDPLSPKQARSIRESTARINLWDGSVRSGKTIASLLRWAEFVLSHDGNGDLVMVGKTGRTLERNALGPLSEMLGHRAVRYTAGGAEARILGRKVYRVGANDERAEQKIRGGTFAGLYGDEVSLWPESFFCMGLSRLSVRNAKFFGTTNPDAPKHWLKAGYIDRAGELDLARFHFTLDDNRSLDPAFVAALKREYVGLWHKRFILGLWVMAEGAIWDSFDEDVHVVEAIPDEVAITRWIVGVDYGTSNPFVALLVGVDGEGRYWVADELRWDARKAGRQKTDAQYRADLAAWLQSHGKPIERIYVDPSAASFVVECRERGLDTVAQARNEVDDGLRLVSTCIGKGALRVARGASGLIQEIPGYIWDAKAQERGVDQPLKQNDHGPDALRYAIASDTFGHVDLDGYGWM